MSDFMEFKVESIKDSTVCIRVWYFYDCNRIQNTIDWMFLSMNLASDKIQSLFNEFYFKIQKDEDPEIEDKYLYIVDIQCETLPEVSYKLIKSMKITDIQNLKPSIEYFNGNLEFEEHLKVSPNALYEVTFIENKYAYAFEIGQNWTGPCFDLLNPSWLLSKNEIYLEIEFMESYHKSQKPEFKFREFTIENEKPNFEKSNIDTYEKSTEFIRNKIDQGWKLVYQNHDLNPKNLIFENE